MKRIIFIVTIIIALFSGVSTTYALDGYYGINSCPQGYSTDYGSCIIEISHFACSNSVPFQACKCIPNGSPTASTPTPPPPVCNGACDTIATQCPLECPVCVSNGKFASSGTCQAPPPENTPTPRKTKTPTPTPPDNNVCNKSCDDNYQCALGEDGCTVCRPGSNGQKTCQPPATPTLTPTLPASTPTPTSILTCNTTCDNSTECARGIDGCSVCRPGSGGINRCQPPATPTLKVTVTPKPPTPTPDFNNDMCKCDGISNTPLASGRPFTVTAKAKVMGVDVSKARLTGMKFRLFEGKTKLTETNYLPVTITNDSSTLVNYSSVWNATMPTSVKKNTEYRIQAVLRCAPKTTAMSNVSAVMGESISSQTSFLSNVGGFVKDLAFRIYSLPMRASRIASEDSLQLATFTTMEVTKTSCDFIYFKTK